MKTNTALFLAILVLVLAFASFVAVGCKSTLPNTIYVGAQEPPAVAEPAPAVDEAAPPAPATEPAAELKFAYDIPAGWDEEETDDPAIVIMVSRSSDGASMGIIETDVATPEAAVTFAMIIAIEEMGCLDASDVISSEDGSSAAGLAGECDDGGVVANYAENFGGTVYLATSYWPDPSDADAETFANLTESFRME